MSRVLGHICGLATIFCGFKGNSPKYKGKHANGPFGSHFLQEGQNQLNSFCQIALLLIAQLVEPVDLPA